LGELRVLSLFSGIGAYEKSLSRLEIPFELVNYCEINKYASKSYSLVHNISEDKNLVDVREVKDIQSEIDLMSWSFPCTSVSLGGKKQGFYDEDGNLTSSGLYYDGLRILNLVKPKYSIIENVKGLLLSFRKEFEQILQDLDKAGYNTYWKLLNSLDYGLPQQRERVFIVSIRKDVDDGSFKFKDIEQEKPLKLKDFLVSEEEVHQKYYLNAKILSQYKEKYSINKKSNVITLGQVSTGNSQAGKVYSIEGSFPTLCAGTHGYANGYIKIGDKIRKLTPIEFSRLMGFEDKDVLKCQENGISDTQLYKMFGNSVVVNILDMILTELLKYGR